MSENPFEPPVNERQAVRLTNGLKNSRLLGAFYFLGGALAFVFAGYEAILGDLMTNPEENATIVLVFTGVALFGCAYWQFKN
ncbi:MAG: hypothetical protein KDA60_18135 [Planctomycetales bacterium]|nr:hypothetical protein [Planctomycetales bacterium]